MNKVTHFLLLVILVLAIGMSLTAQAMKPTTNPPTGNFLPTRQLKIGAAVTPTQTPVNTGPSIPTRTPVYTGPSIPTRTPIPGDIYERDGNCNSAKTISTNGIEQDHNFHILGDEDWVKFNAVAGVNYQIIGDVSNISPVDLSLQLYSVCDMPALQRPRYTFGSGAKMLFTAPQDGTFYLKLSNYSSTFGNNAAYQLSVRALNREVGSVIIVGGRFRMGDPLQRNIHNMTNKMYRLYRQNGFSNDQIMYFATDSFLDPSSRSVAYVDGLPTNANLENAIVNWAKDHVNPEHGLTLYLMSHGHNDELHLDTPNDEILSPTDLNSWLEQLEADVPGLKTSIIIDACNSGSFIEIAQSLSKPGRIVIASAEPNQDAAASLDGAEFSESFISSLQEGNSVSYAFKQAYYSVWEQIPWIDSNGNSLPNEIEDLELASQTGLNLYASDSAGQPQEVWRPYLPEPVQPGISRGEATLFVTVENDNDIDEISEVTGIVYPPSYVSPVPAGELIDRTGLQTVTFELVNANNYEAVVPLDETGEYQVMVYAEDTTGLVSQPQRIEFISGVPLAITNEFNRSQPFPIALWTIMGIVTATIASLSVAVWFKKRA